MPRIVKAVNPNQAGRGGENGPQEKICYIGHIFAFYATKMGSMDSGETKFDHDWVHDPPWSFNGPCHGPTIHPTWPFIYWIDFCFLRNKNRIKGLWGHKGQPSLGLGPALVLHWALPWPYNTPNMAIYILAIFFVLCNKMGSRDSGDTKVDTH